jgi:hypothetical protein
MSKVKFANDVIGSQEEIKQEEDEVSYREG